MIERVNILFRFSQIERFIWIKIFLIIGLMDLMKVWIN